jgi:hypothetical protein
MVLKWRVVRPDIRIIAPILFHEDIITSKSFLDKQTHALPQVNDKIILFFNWTAHLYIFSHCPSLLELEFPTLLDCFLLSHVKGEMYSQRMNKMHELKAWITATIADVNKDILQCFW